MFPSTRSGPAFGNPSELSFKINKNEKQLASRYMPSRHAHWDTARQREKRGNFDAPTLVAFVLLPQVVCPNAVASGNLDLHLFALRRP
jgi:hypothetical protein